MNAVGKIGVLIPEMIDSLDYELLHGIHVQARKLGYDVLVFTDTFNAINEIYHDQYIGGQENIYQLALSSSLDGILFAAEHFHNTVLRQQIYGVCQKLSIPCLLLEQKHAELPCISAPQDEPMRILTEHLIHQHGCHTLYCLTGRKNDHISQERLNGFCQAMEENGLPVDDRMIFYGDFWKEKPYQLGVDIAEGNIPKPDGIVCASDAMAASLCDALRKNGVRVPEDIAITGYDGQWTAILHTPKITTMAGREAELGGLAVCRLYEMMTGNACTPPQPCQYLRCGTSCGCKIIDTSPEREEILSLEEYTQGMMQRHFERKNFMAADYISNMTDVETPEQLVRKIDALTYTIHGAKWLEICLCKDWMFDFEHPENYRKEGFSEQMLLALSKRTAATFSDMVTFPTRDILPVLQHPHEPLLAVLTSLHHRDQIFGYISLTYRTVGDIFADAHYINWCDAIAGGLDTLQKKQYRSYIRQQIESLSVLDPATGFYNKRGLLERLSDFSSRYTKHDQNYLCMMIAHVQKNNISEQFGSEFELMIANALRLSSDENELLSRLQDNVFAVILPISDDNTEQLANKRILQLEQKIRYMQGSIPQLQMPELITDHSPLQFDKVGESGEFIDEKLKAIMHKAEAVARMSGSYKETFLRLRREIYACPQKEWNLSDVSRTIGISISHFRRIYKAEFGAAFKDDVIEARLEKAKQLLLHTDLRVQEIADACGYYNYSHFMRQFKEKVGATALQYRQDGTE